MKRRENNVGKTLDRTLGLFRSPSPELMESVRERVAHRLEAETHKTPHGPGRDIAGEDVANPRSTLAWRRAAIMSAAAAVLLAITIGITWRHDSAFATVESIDGSLSRITGGHAQALAAGESLVDGETVTAGSGGATLKLADGSGIEMRSKSELRLERTLDGVRILLSRGSVIVNAAKQPAGRHLFVQTKDVAVSVVGTVFLVKAEQFGSRVAVLEGEVRVQSGATTERLFPGEQVATGSQMPARPVIEEILWSHRAEEHLAMLAQSTVPPAGAAAELPDKFEVASIRSSAEVPAGPGARGGGGASVAVPCPTANAFAMAVLFQLDPGRLVMRRQPLYSLIAFAYGNSCPAPDTLTGGPDWTRSERFDLEATIPPGTPGYTKEQLFGGNAPRLQRMLQNLLADRFKLVLKREVQEMPGYNLVVAQEGMLKLSADQTPDQAPTRGARGGGLRGVIGIPSVAAPISRLASTLQRTMDRPIVDKTGLTGLYDILLTFPEIPMSAPPPAGAALSDIEREMNQTESRIRDLLPAKLESTTGLRLEPANVPVEVLVIVSAEKPSQN